MVAVRRKLLQNKIRPTLPSAHRFKGKYLPMGHPRRGCPKDLTYPTHPKGQVGYSLDLPRSECRGVAALAIKATTMGARSTLQIKAHGRLGIVQSRRRAPPRLIPDIYNAPLQARRPRALCWSPSARLVETAGLHLHGKGKWCVFHRLARRS